MGKRFINIISLCLTILLAFSLIGCSNTTKKTSTDKTFQQTIDEKLYNITHPKDSQILLSSNPYDYIKSGETNKDYKYIVSQGRKSLDYMQRLPYVQLRI